MARKDAQMQCPACGDRIYPNDQNCLSCGARLDEGRLVGEKAQSAEDVEAPPRGQPMPETAFPSESGRSTAGNVAEAAPGQAPQREVGYSTGAGRWDPSQLTGGGGFFDSLSRGWSFLKESIAMAFRDKDLFIPSVLAVLANLVVLGGLAGILYLTGDFDAIFGDEAQQITVIGYVIMFVVALISYTITYFFTGMTVHLVDVHLRGEDAKLGSAFADSVKNFGGIAALAVASIVVAMIAGAIRGKGRGLRRAAADTVERGWTAITYLLLPIMILEDVPFMKSAERAKGLHSHNVIQIVVGELGLMLASRVISGVVMALGIAFAVGSYFLSPALLPVGIAVAVLLFVLASAFAAYVRTAFYTCLYLWAVAMDTVGEEAPAPAPLRPAISAGW
jgi:hypothetical protein